MEWKRKFSTSTYKNFKIKLGEMSFLKDFTTTTRGDLYPIIKKSEDASESIESNSYSVKKGFVKRLFCQLFPFATYEATFLSDGEVGFCFALGDTPASITVYNGSLNYSFGNRKDSVKTPLPIANERTLIVSCRPGAFDVYLKRCGKAEYFHTFYEEAFKTSNDYSVFSDSYVYLSASEGACVKEVLSYIDSGVSIADVRPIKYENGEVLNESGRIYFSASVRMQESSFQGIFSWIPGTAELAMTGAVFYDIGDGVRSRHNDK